MADLNLFTGNRLEHLVHRLAGVLHQDPPDPMAREIVVVQNRGMQKWISLETARINGISANMVFPFPRAFVYTLFQAAFDLPDTSFYSPGFMAWRIMETLDSLLETEEFSALKGYVKEDPSGLKQYQLSEKIAQAFDQYLIARPDMINEWDRGENSLAAEFPESRWQAVLWRAIAGNDRPLHHADLRQIFFEKLNSPGFIQALNLPGRVSLFGISTLSPFYVELFSHLSRFMEVNIFYLNPCREFWEYAFSEKEIARFAGSGMEEEDEYYERGNELLASMGTAGREFFSLLLSRVDHVGEELFFDPGTGSMLDLIQSDILNLVDRKEQSPLVLDNSDRSVEIHACHGRVREVEVLHDSLLSFFEEDKDLVPGDIVVMMPDVTVYAPLIQAVFDPEPDGTRKIPYSIADTVINAANPIAKAFVSILNLGRNRYRASDLLDILDAGPVRRQFGLSSEDLDLIRLWVKETRTCWGIDGEYRESLGLPGFHENSWQFGLERMLLGHALPPDQEEGLFAGIFPYGEIEGEGAVILGKFAAFLDLLFVRVRDLDRERSLERWAHAMNRIVTDFFLLERETENDLNELRSLFTDKGLAGIAETVTLTRSVSFEVVKAFIEKNVQSGSSERGFLTTGVTFCTLLPMRSIPFKAVCLMGMNDGEFPGMARRPGFDLVGKKRRLCDWQKRSEDRYLFLESILSARQKLMISYVGQGIKDNAPIPPSVLVSELVDYLASVCAPTETQTVADRLVIRHPLQPFSRRYFTGSNRLFSYSRENFSAAVARGSSQKSPVLVPRPLWQSDRGVDPVTESPRESPRESSRESPQEPFPDSFPDSFREISGEEFCRFFASPARFLANRILNLRLTPDDHSAAETREPFDLDSLEQYWLKDEVLDFLVSHRNDSSREKNLETLYQTFKASGRLPQGGAGYGAFRQCRKEVEPFFETLVPYIEAREEDPVETRIVINPKDPALPGGAVTAVFTTLYSQGQLFYRCARLKPRDLLWARVFHLLGNLAFEDEAGRTTRVFGTDDAMTFSPMAPAAAMAELETLWSLFHRGLQLPLPFFPDTSFAFARTVVEKNRGEEEGLKAAKKIWHPGYYHTGENEDVYVRACFGDDFPGDHTFKAAALDVFAPCFG